MTKTSRLEPEVEERLPDIFKQFSERLTKDFSARDWLALYENAVDGDPISQQMFIDLLNSKVYPHLDMDEVYRFMEEKVKD